MKSRGEYRSAPVLVLTLIAFGLSMSLLVDEGAAGTSDAAETSFCRERALRDYEAPLRGLPAAEPIPWVLPFGPATIKVRHSPIPRRSGFPELESFARGKRLAYPRERPEFSLYNSSGDELKLNWKIKVTISRAGAEGAPASFLSATTMAIASLGPRSSALVRGEGSPALGTVRVDYAFLDHEEAVMGSFFEYVQVVPFKVEARVRLRPRAVPAGGVLRFRLENLGTTEVRSGGYRLQRYEANGWQEAPHQHARPVTRRRLSPGHAGNCQWIGIPKSAEPGLYRLQVRPFSLHRRVHPLGRYVTKTFKVTGTAAR
jgi:hypothetical protein